MEQERSTVRRAGYGGMKRQIYRLRRCNYRGLPATLHSDRPPDALAESALAEAQAKCAALNDSLLRARAEIENVRKRAARERDEANRRAGEATLQALLPVFDNLMRAVQAAGNSDDAKALLQGVSMICEQFRTTLGAQGVEPVDALGQTFDPHLHEAVGVEESEDAVDNQIVTVLQEGFKLRGRLLRPAVVRVSRKKAT